MKTINSFRSKLLALVLALVASVSTFAQAPDFKVGELYYKVLKGDTVEVTYRQRPVLPTGDSTATPKKNSEGLGYENFTEVVIPSMITYEDKTYHVTRIGHGTFWLCDKLTYVDIPNTIKSIGIAAFRSCRTLASITLNEGLESIEHHAFYDCVRLKEVTLPSTLKTMGQSIFAFSTDLEKVTCKAIVPPTVEKDVLTDIDNYNASIIPNATLYVPASSLTTYQNTYPWNTFGQILSIEDSLQNIFPTLAGLQRTHTIEMYDHAPNDGKRSGGYPLPFASVKDTVINGKTYLQFGDYVNGSNYSLFFLREENNKVLIYSSILQEDLVLYDYTLKLGDSLPAITSDHDYFSDDHFTKLDKAENIFTYVVTDVSTITLLDGIERKKWILKNKYLPIIEYVEGIGCYSENTSHSGDFFRLIHDHPYTTEYVGDHLVCVSKNGQLLYSMPQEEMNSFTLTCECLSQEDTIAPEDLFPTLWGLQQTICSGYYGEEGDEWASGLTGPSQEITMMDGKPYLQWGSWYLREENDKILVYSEIQKKDLVLYDFTLELGDTLTTLNFVTPEFLEYEGIVGIVDYPLSDYDYTYPIDTLVVTELSKETLLDGKEYTRWKFSDGTVYVEGIGSMSETFFHHIADHLPVPVSYLGSYLVCVSKNNKLLYQMDDAEMERLGAECLCEYTAELTPEDLFPTLWGLQRTDVELHTTRDNELYRSTFNEYIHFVPSKKQRIYLTYDGQTYLREENNQVLLYAPSYGINEDIVLYDWTLEKSDTLQVGLYDEIERGKLFRVTDVSTVTLLDGKEYKKWTLACGIEYIEGIGAINGEGFGNYLCLQHKAHPATYIGSPLVCASRNGQLLYQMDDAEMERLGAECLCQAEQKPEDLFPTLWGLQRTACSEYTDCEENVTYLMQADEIKEINGKLYLKYGGVFLREEDSKVLIYSFPYEKDFVLYDWTLEIGDTLQNLGIDPYSFPELEYAAVVDYIVYEDYDVEIGDFIIKKEPLGNKRVKDISTIRLLDGNEYKAWLFGYDWERGDYYVEGIGNANKYGGDYVDLAHPFPVPTCYYGERLVCVSRDGVLLYQIDDAEMERLGTECLCDYNSGPKKDNAKNGKIGGRPTPTQWNMLEVETKEMDGTPTILRAETFSYTLENDSIVTKGKTFYQLARQSTKDTAITKSFVGALHFGEDEDNRVYFLRDGVEYVLYDFTAEPGDTIEIFAGINNYPQETTYTHVVTGKDTLENGACRMMLEVVFPEETTTATNAEKVWLAGLGSIDGIVHNAAKRTSDVHAAPRRSASSETQTSVMLCAWREDSCLYTTNHPEYDTFGCVYNQDPTAVEDVETLGTQYQKILRDGHLYILRDNKLYDVLGTPMN